MCPVSAAAAAMAHSPVQAGLPGMQVRIICRAKGAASPKGRTFAASPRDWGWGERCDGALSEPVPGFSGLEGGQGEGDPAPGSGLGT